MVATVRPAAVRVIAVLAVLLLGAQASGVARAMEAASRDLVRCCCGLHARDHACGCRNCPAGHHHRRGPALPTGPTIDDCHGAAPDALAPALPWVAPPIAPSIAPPDFAPIESLLAPPPPAGHLPGVPRPPP